MLPSAQRMIGALLLLSAWVVGACGGAGAQGGGHAMLLSDAQSRARFLSGEGSAELHTTSPSFCKNVEDEPCQNALYLGLTQDGQRALFVDPSGPPFSRVEQLLPIDTPEKAAAVLWLKGRAQLESGESVPIDVPGFTVKRKGSRYSVFAYGFSHEQSQPGGCDHGVDMAISALISRDGAIRYTQASAARVVHSCPGDGPFAVPLDEEP